MAETRISAQVRDPKRMTNLALRRSGQVPAIYYNRDGANRTLQFDSRTLTKLLRKEIGILRVDLDGETLDCIIREVQRDPVRREVIHIDLMGVAKGQKIRAHVPVHVTGTAVGMKAGGLLEVVMRDLDVECEPSALPAFIELDVTNLALNDAIKLGDLNYEGVIFHGDATAPVVHVVPPRTTAVEEASAAAPAETKEPEVIRERKPTDEEKK